MKKMTLLYFTFGIFSNLLYGYDALLSPINSRTSSLQIIHEGNSKEELKRNINSSFVEISIGSYVKFQDESNKIIENIIVQNKYADQFITFIKDIVNVINLSQIKASEASIRTIVKESIVTFDRSLKQFGITLSSGGKQKVVDWLVQILLESIDAEGKFTKSIKTGALFYAGIALDVASIANDITATVRMNNFLFYYQIDELANAYIDKYLDALLDNQKVFTLEYFFNHYYFLDGKYYTWDEFVKTTGKYPVFGDKIISHLKVANNILGTLDEECSTTSKCIQLFPKLIVVAPLDVWHDTYEEYIGMDKFKIKLKENIDKKLGQLGIHQNLLFYMKIDDNFELNSMKGKTLTTKLTHKISDLSKVTVSPISTKNKEIAIYPYCGRSFDGVKDKILALHDTKLFYKVDKCKDDDNDYSSLLISYNKKIYNLIDDFKLLKRYQNVKETYGFHSLYDHLRSLKIKGINLKEGKELYANNVVTASQANSIIAESYNFLVRQTDMYGNRTHLDNLGFSGKVTYSKLFLNLEILMKHFYTDQYYLLDGKARYPFPNASIKEKVIFKMDRIAAKKYNSSNYKKYLEKLSKAGIIKFDLTKLLKKLEETVTVKDFVMYINRILEY